MRACERLKNLLPAPGCSAQTCLNEFTRDDYGPVRDAHMEGPTLQVILKLPCQHNDRIMLLCSILIRDLLFAALASQTSLYGILRQRSALHILKVSWRILNTCMQLSQASESDEPQNSCEVLSRCDHTDSRFGQKPQSDA